MNPNNDLNSKMETSEASFTWTIRDFWDSWKFRPWSLEESISSPVFSANKPDGNETQWRLKLYPIGSTSPSDYLAIEIQSYTDMTIRVNCEISILNSSSERTEVLDCSGYYSPDEPLKHFKTWLLKNSLWYCKNSDLLPQGHLNIHLQITIYGEERELISYSRFQGMEKVREDFGRLFCSREFSDVDIKIQGEVFKCHKAILSTRSNYFRAIFQQIGSKEVNIHSIQHFEPPVVGEVLHFIYTGVLSDLGKSILKQSTHKLLALAERFQLNVLKKICEERLCLTLRVDNSIQYLRVGEVFGAMTLRRMALELVARRMSLLGSEPKTMEYLNEFRLLVQDHPTLAKEIGAATNELRKQDRMNNLTTLQTQIGG